MTEELKSHLQSLAQRYETTSFLESDPSQFIRWYERVADVEAACFIAAMLSFGSRTQFIPKIQRIFERADCAGGMAEWLLSRGFEADFAPAPEKFYRFYSFSDMNALFCELLEILREYGTLGLFFRKKYDALDPEQKTSGALASLISAAFPRSRIVPKGKSSANKRIHMFLRWMVRQNSPVDIGLWDWYPAQNLLIPLDVHVMQEGIRLGLLPPNARATRQTALALTAAMNEVFPGDPSRADFALFGLGVA